MSSPAKYSKSYFCGCNFAKLFDIQNKKFVTVSCCDCGYTELYKQPEDGGMNVLDFLFGGN